jgi:hypothetical protein
MDFYNYLAINCTQDALSVLKQWSNIRVNDEQELADGLRAVISQLSDTDKQDMLTNLAEIHPDRKMISEVFDLSKEIKSDNGGHECNCPNCQVKFGANGQTAVANFMSSGDVKTLLDKETQTLKQAIDTQTQTTNTSQLMNEKIFKLVMAGAVVYLIYKITNK